MRVVLLNQEMFASEVLIRDVCGSDLLGFSVRLHFSNVILSTPGGPALLVQSTDSELVR